MERLFFSAGHQFILPPLLPSSAWSGSLGEVGLDPQPEPAAPPLLIITIVPTMEMPEGLISMKLPADFQRQFGAGFQNDGHAGLQVNDLSGFVSKISAGFLI